MTAFEASGFIEVTRNAAGDVVEMRVHGWDEWQPFWSAKRKMSAGGKAGAEKRWGQHRDPMPTLLRNADRGAIARETRGRERERQETTTATACAEAETSPASTPPPGPSFPVMGPPGEWPLPQPLADELTAAYPALDLPDEFRHARAWLVADPTRRKTRRGMGRFLAGWLSRSQNNGARKAGGRATKHGGKTEAEYNAYLDSLEDGA